MSPKRWQPGTICPCSSSFVLVRSHLSLFVLVCPCSSSFVFIRSQLPLPCSSSFVLVRSHLFLFLFVLICPCSYLFALICLWSLLFVLVRNHFSLFVLNCPWSSMSLFSDQDVLAPPFWCDRFGTGLLAQAVLSHGRYGATGLAQIYIDKYTNNVA